MKIMRIGIKSLGEGFSDFQEAFASAQRRHPFKAKKGAYFTSLGAARNFLTPRRLELLHVIKTRCPKSLYELARLSGRSFPSIARDMALLARHGLVQLNRNASTPRRTVSPQVPYDAINLWIGI